VAEPGVLSAGEGEVPEAELADPAEPLELRRLDEREEQALRDGDEPVDGVGEDLEPAGHGGRGRGEGGSYLSG
jgi:hypothetical protein